MTVQEWSLWDPPPRPTIEQAFADFHAANPWVYDRLRDLALDLVHRGHQRIGVGMLWEVLRWSEMQTADPGSGWKLNNSLRSRYARLLMDREHELADAFETRELRS